MKTKFRLSLIGTMIFVALFMTSCFIENDVPVDTYYDDEQADIKVITFTINYNAWGRDNSDRNFWYYTYNTSMIDYYVVDNGAVLFYYGNYDNSGYVNKWYSIPFTNVYYDNNLGGYYERVYDASYEPGILELEIKDTNPIRFEWAEEKDIKIKAIILEGHRYNMLKKNDIDLKNYSEVSSALNLKTEDNTK